MTEKDTTASNITGGAPSPMELVKEFHRTYSMPIRSFDDPTLSYDRLGMRMSLIAEEFAELMGAVYGKRARAIIEAATATSSKRPMRSQTSSTLSTAWRSSREWTSTPCSLRCRHRTCPSSCRMAPSSCVRMERCSRGPTSSRRMLRAAWASSATDDDAART